MSNTNTNSYHNTDLSTKKDLKSHDAYTSTQGTGIFQYKPKMFGAQSNVGLLSFLKTGLISTNPNCAFAQAEADHSKYNYTQLKSNNFGLTYVFEANYEGNLVNTTEGKPNAGYSTVSDIMENWYYSKSSDFTTSTYTPTQYAIPMITLNGTPLMSWSDYISKTPIISNESWINVPSTAVPTKSPVSYLTDSQWLAIVDAYAEAIDKQDINLVSRVSDLIYFAKVLNQQSNNQQLSVDVGYGQRVFNAGSQADTNIKVIQISLSNSLVSTTFDTGTFFGNNNTVMFQRQYDGNTSSGVTWSCNASLIGTLYSQPNNGLSARDIALGAGAFNWNTINYWHSHNNENPETLDPIPPIGWAYWPGGQFGGTVTSNFKFNIAVGSMNYTGNWQNYVNYMLSEFMNADSGTWPATPGQTTLFETWASYDSLIYDPNGKDGASEDIYAYMWADNYEYNYKISYNSTADEGTEQRKDYFSGLLYLSPLNCTYSRYKTTALYGVWTATAISAQLTIPVMSFTIEPLMGKHKVRKSETELGKLADYYYNIADHIVAAYYNAMLQKEEFWLRNYNQAGSATPLQKVFALGVKFNFTSDILTEIINQYPFKVLPQSIQTMVNVINTGTTDGQQVVKSAVKVVTKIGSSTLATTATQTDDLQPNDTVMSNYTVDNDELIDEIGLFLATPVPNASNVYSNNPDLWNDLQSAFNTFVNQANSDIVLADGSTASVTPIDNTPLPNPLNVNGELMPSTFREVILKVMSAGAFIQHVEAYLRLGSLHNLLLSKNPITNQNMQLPTVTQVTASPYTIPDTSMTNIGTVDTARNHQDLDDVRKQMDDKVSNIERNLIYPIYDSIIEDIKDDVAAVRQLTEDRLHGMSYAIYAPELRYVFAKRIGITHRLVHMFSSCVKTVKFVVTPFYDLLKDLDAKLGNIVNTLVMKPLTQTVETIAKVGLSMLLAGSDLVSPGSEILTWISDANIERPIPTPLSPFGVYLPPSQSNPNGVDNRLFSKVVLNGSNAQWQQTFAGIECIVPGIGFADRSKSCAASVYYNESLNSYALEVDIQSNVISVCGTKYVTTDPVNNTAPKDQQIKKLVDAGKDAKKVAKVADSNADITYEPTIISGNDSKMVIYNVTPGVHSIQFLTAAGSVRMWFSATQTLSDDGNSFVNANLSESTSPNEYVKVGSKGFICFVPDPVVTLDGRISLPKTFHKWILAGLHIPYFVFPRGEDTNYHNAINYLESLKGFDNVKSHICTDGMTYAYIADGAAMTIAWSMAIKQICTAGIRSSIESFSLASEYAANIAHITMEYNKARSENVLNAYINNYTNINNILASAWPCLGTGAVNMQLWEFLQDDVQSSPDFNVPGWYPETWERLLGDVLLGIAKMTFFTYLQHRVFKKINAKATVVAKTKTKLSSVLWNKYKRHEQEVDTGKDVDKDLGNKNTAKDEKDILRKQDAELDDSFIETRDLQGLRSYVLNNSKSVKQLLSDQTTIGQVLDDIKNALNSFGSFRGLN